MWMFRTFIRVGNHNQKFPWLWTCPRTSIERDNGYCSVPRHFDPVTHGHLDVLSRASRLFDKVIVAVASGNSAKSTMFSPEERVSMVEENLGEFTNVSVELFDGLLVEHARTGEPRFWSVD